MEILIFGTNFRVTLHLPPFVSGNTDYVNTTVSLYMLCFDNTSSVWRALNIHLAISHIHLAIFNKICLQVEILEGNSM